LVPEEFNAEKTWTEYINRLIGAISGVFLFLSAVLPLVIGKADKLIAHTKHAQPHIGRVSRPGWALS
jgi:heme A synthase